MKAFKSFLCIFLIFTAVFAIIAFPPRIIPSSDNIEFLDFQIKRQAVEKISEIAKDIAGVSTKMMPQPIVEMLKAYAIPPAKIKSAFSMLAKSE